jgi:hypothetical protein
MSAEALEETKGADGAGLAPFHDPEAVKLLMSRVRRDPETGCLHWHSSKSGKRIRGSLMYRGVKILAHRLSYIAHRGPIEDGLVVCHRCDNPSCIAIEHLFAGTQQENISDMWKKGRERWGLAKLFGDEVAEMKRRLEAGESIAAIARDHRVSYSLVLQIKHGKTWKDVRPAEKSMRQLTIERIGRLMEIFLPEEDREKLWRLAELRNPGWERPPLPSDRRPPSSCRSEP